ncbi:MAG: hypothetical protein A2493_03220 [Candidatus Magasanikbacteria bacterium RIFOXYC12_FULL_33_11]|uniref:Uncharacterized protein n=1 Tax=Candidatus Magasanikbacteria bacterium RIFOXYC12_FULL_33_11 TaxID=1798701 RepID=A0A1F6NRY4_9BACT|nr:MAG: hypothetical protein A2493_03220 [Candidatus Magasanikbacteria bacterium RIFOXYC12_FULL_33_11]
MQGSCKALPIEMLSPIFFLFNSIANAENLPHFSKLRVSTRIQDEEEPLYPALGQSPLDADHRVDPTEDESAPF